MLTSLSIPWGNLLVQESAQQISFTFNPSFLDTMTTIGLAYSVVQACTILAPKITSALTPAAILRIQGTLAQFTAQEDRP